jgi:hypothetical protein
MMQKIKTAVLAVMVCFTAVLQPLHHTFGRAAQSIDMLSCSTPTVSVSGQGADSFSFTVQSGSGAAQYKYVNKSTGTTSGTISISDGTTVVGSLPAATYTFYFRSVCGGEVSEWIVIDDLTTF